MGWKYGVHEREHSDACFNACVFETKEEAERAAQELFSRWFLPHHWSLHEVDETVNYRFPEDASRPQRIETEVTP